LSVFYTFIDIKTYSSLVKHFDYERIAEFIENNEESNTPLVFYNGRNSIPFQYYYHGINKIVQLPIPSDYKLRSDQDYLIKDTMTLNTIFQRDLRTAKNFYYLSNKEDEMIETYLVENFLVQLDTLIFDRAKINGLRVRKLIRKK
jgi:rRNA maturation protein Rpf1